MSPIADRRESAPTVAVAGVLAVCAYAAVALMQILVWNPEAAVPGVPADEVWRRVGEANQGPPNAFVVGIVAVGPLFALVLLLLFTVTGAGVWPVVSGYLGLLALGAPGYVMASFGPGMGLADTFAIGGADAAIGGAVLFGVSLLALGVLAGILVGSAVRRARERNAVAAM